MKNILFLFLFLFLNITYADLIIVNKKDADNQLKGLIVTMEKLENQLSVKNPEIEKLREQIEKMGLIINENPEKSMSLPLIKKDLNYLKEENKDIKGQINNYTNLMIWLIGIIIAIVGGVFVFIVPFLLKFNKSLIVQK